MNNRMYLTLSSDAISVLERRASERKRGELVSKLLIEYDKTLANETAISNLEERVDKLEQTLAAMIADNH